MPNRLASATSPYLLQHRDNPVEWWEWQPEAFVEAARRDGLTARLLVPLTRGHGDAALQFEVELTSLDRLDQFRHRGAGSSEAEGGWIHAFSAILVSPPHVEILRVDTSQSA